MTKTYQNKKELPKDTTSLTCQGAHNRDFYGVGKPIKVTSPKLLKEEKSPDEETSLKMLVSIFKSYLSKNTYIPKETDLKLFQSGYELVAHEDVGFLNKLKYALKGVQTSTNSTWENEFKLSKKKYSEIRWTNLYIETPGILIYRPDDYKPNTPDQGQSYNQSVGNFTPIIDIISTTETPNATSYCFFNSRDFCKVKPGVFDSANDNGLSKFVKDSFVDFVLNKEFVLQILTNNKVIHSKPDLDFLKEAEKKEISIGLSHYKTPELDLIEHIKKACEKQSTFKTELDALIEAEQRKSAKTLKLSDLLKLI